MHRAELKEKLALTAEQEVAWNTFAESAQRGPRHAGMDRKAMLGEFGKLSTREPRPDAGDVGHAPRHAAVVVTPQQTGFAQAYVWLHSRSSSFVLSRS